MVGWSEEVSFPLCILRTTESLFLAWEFVPLRMPQFVRTFLVHITQHSTKSIINSKFRYDGQNESVIAAKQKHTPRIECLPLVSFNFISSRSKCQTMERAFSHLLVCWNLEWSNFYLSQLTPTDPKIPFRNVATGKARKWENPIREKNVTVTSFEQLFSNRYNIYEHIREYSKKSTF